MKLEEFLIQEEGDDSRKLPDGRFASTWDSLGRVWNIGPGITVGVTKNTVWTQAQLDAAEAKEFADVVACVARCVKVEITSNERVALESLAYNIGDSGFEHSSVLRELNAGHYAAACQAFLLWVHCHGAIVPGLIKRRKDEMRLFNHPDDAPVPADLRAVKTPLTATMKPEVIPMATATVTVPVDTLKAAANVSQTSIKSSFTLGGLGSILAFAAPLLATFDPTLAHVIVAAATSIVGIGVAVTGVVHALHLNSNAEAVTNAFIDSVIGIAKEISTDFGGSANPTQAA